MTSSLRILSIFSRTHSDADSSEEKSMGKEKIMFVRLPVLGVA